MNNACSIIPVLILTQAAAFEQGRGMFFLRFSLFTGTLEFESNIRPG
jgi:hypothetical protein